ncbi:unnamed protein product [Protopolystoma xenopodis]|uniref:Uncharacterized protein n=1 Tax=Protopolystoma xenopodis TaxID=117903 RepID=A0A3S4ZMR1_9PLAT|nr:unnamed protein product [Protopolystoma xenopodis]
MGRIVQSSSSRKASHIDTAHCLADAGLAEAILSSGRCGQLRHPHGKISSTLIHLTMTTEIIRLTVVLCENISVLCVCLCLCVME